MDDTAEKRLQPRLLGRVKQHLGKITNYYSKLGVAEITMETNELSVGDDLLIVGPTTGVYEMKVNEIRVDLNPVQKTVKGEICSVPVSETVRRGDKVYKWVAAEEEL